MCTTVLYLGPFLLNIYFLLFGLKWTYAWAGQFRPFMMAGHTILTSWNKLSKNFIAFGTLSAVHRSLSCFFSYRIWKQMWWATCLGLAMQPYHSPFPPWFLDILAARQLWRQRLAASFVSSWWMCDQGNMLMPSWERGHTFYQWHYRQLTHSCQYDHLVVDRLD